MGERKGTLGLNGLMENTIFCKAPSNFQPALTWKSAVLFCWLSIDQATSERLPQLENDNLLGKF